MNINCVSGISFKGVIPVNVYNNDLRVYNENFVRSACRKATKFLAGPIDQDHYEFAKQLEALDDSYKFKDAVRGYCREWRDFRTGEFHCEVPSDYFKIVFDRKSNPYIITGIDAVNLATIGKALGIEKKKCRDARVSETVDLIALKKYYNTFVNSLVENKEKRLKNNMHLGIAVRSKGMKNSVLEDVFLIQG